MSVYRNVPPLNTTLVKITRTHSYNIPVVNILLSTILNRRTFKLEQKYYHKAVCIKVPLKVLYIILPFTKNASFEILFHKVLFDTNLLNLEKGVLSRCPCKFCSIKPPFNLNSINQRKMNFPVPLGRPSLKLILLSLQRFFQLQLSKI